MKIELVDSPYDGTIWFNEREPYFEKYYKEFGVKPSWIVQHDDEYRSSYPEFEEWYIVEKRNEKLNKLGL